MMHLYGALGKGLTRMQPALRQSFRFFSDDATQTFKVYRAIFNTTYRKASYEHRCISDILRILEGKSSLIRYFFGEGRRHNLSFLLNHQYLPELVDILEIADEHKKLAGPDSVSRFINISNHGCLLHFHFCFYTLDKAQLLTPERFEAIAEFEAPQLDFFTQMIAEAKQQNNLLPEYVDMLIYLSNELEFSSDLKP